MRKTILLIVVMLFVASVASAEYYALTVTRTDSNEYEIQGYGSSGYWFSETWYIITKPYCFEYVYSDKAILVYNQYSYNNKLVFSNGAECDFESLRIVEDYR